MPNLQFAPGETNVTEAQFSPSVVLFWLRTSVGVSSTRIVTHEPNTILGVIPLGYNDRTYPLRQVAGVQVNAKASVARFLLGLILFFTGISLLTKSPLGIFLVLIGVALLANAMSAAMIIQNSGGGLSGVRVSIFQKKKLEAFREEVNQRVFADQELLRHTEHMQVQNQQLYVQQQQLNAQIMQQNAALQQQLGQQPGGVVPPPGTEPPSV